MAALVSPGSRVTVSLLTLFPISHPLTRYRVLLVIMKISIFFLTAGEGKNKSRRETLKEWKLKEGQKGKTQMNKPPFRAGSIPTKATGSPLFVPLAVPPRRKIVKGLRVFTDTEEIPGPNENEKIKKSAMTEKQEELPGSSKETNIPPPPTTPLHRLSAEFKAVQQSIDSLISAATNLAQACF